MPNYSFLDTQSVGWFLNQSLCNQCITCILPAWHQHSTDASLITITRIAGILPCPLPHLFSGLHLSEFKSPTEQATEWSVGTNRKTRLVRILRGTRLSFSPAKLSGFCSTVILDDLILAGFCWLFGWLFVALLSSISETHLDALTLEFVLFQTKNRRFLLFSPISQLSSCSYQFGNVCFPTAYEC